jgi:hypothetical protein
VLECYQPGKPTHAGQSCFDAAKVQDMPGVKHVVKVGNSAVAVVAERWWQAKTALDARRTSPFKNELENIDTKFVHRFLYRLPIRMTGRIGQVELATPRIECQSCPNSPRGS